MAAENNDGEEDEEQEEDDLDEDPDFFHIDDDENMNEDFLYVVKKSLIIEKGGDSSFKVVTNIANTMIGSSIIVYPIMFIKDGIIGSLLVLLTIGAFLYLTCRLLLLHNRHDEMEFG